MNRCNMNETLMLHTRVYEPKIDDQWCLMYVLQGFRGKHAYVRAQTIHTTHTYTHANVVAFMPMMGEQKRVIHIPHAL